MSVWVVQSGTEHTREQNVYRVVELVFASTDRTAISAQKFFSLTSDVDHTNTAKTQSTEYIDTFSNRRGLLLCSRSKPANAAMGGVIV